MSKKTNKTNHVLSLLSNGVKAEEEKETDTADRQEIKKDQPSSVSIVKEEAENDVAENIRRSLEKQMAEYEEAVKKARDAVGESDVPGGPAFQSELSAQPAEKRETEGKDTPPEHTDDPVQEKKTSEVDSEPEKSDECREEDNFIIVNVMETLVRERAPEYIRQFGVCTCRRCQMAVEAEALTELPAKYVVINRHAISPLINFYRTKFAGRVTVEVAKACMSAKNNPPHEKNADESADGSEKNEKKA